MTYPELYPDLQPCTNCGGTLGATKLCKDCSKKRAIDKNETVDHPPHYNAHPSGVECIDVVEHMSFNVGNAMKYLWRADHKDSAVEDLKKASWYIQRELQRIQKRGH